METNPIELPDNWEQRRRSDNDSVTGAYQHKYLGVEIHISKHDPDDFDEDVDSEWVYDYFVEWSADVGGVEDAFDPPGTVTTATEAANWAIGLMNQISNQYEPGDTGYIPRAMRATKGEETGVKSKSSGSYHGDPVTCPACGAFFFQFRGFDTYEQAQNHFEFMDDEEHEDWDISLTESE